MKIIEVINSFLGKTKNNIGRLRNLPDNTKNPWPGLSAYNDPISSDVKHKFCGRGKETFELTRMIDDNIFVTLYGKSGNGKTSLLNAGVFPQLRKMQYAPISIRLSLDSMGISFQQCIIQKIENYFTNELIEEIPVIQPTNNISSADYLWNYFARHRFFADKKHETIVYPVIALDQFEEVYRNRNEEADILLKQINYLIDESHELEDCQIEGILYTYEYNFRFLVSIREDDLYWLEDSIDNCMLYPMKETRYRLRPLSLVGAYDVIFIPGEGLFDEKDKNKIFERIIHISQGENGEISSNILSLICNRIYINYYQEGNKGFISYDLVNNFVSDKPLEKFYLEATANLTNKQRAFLEDNLVDKGRRSYVKQEDFNHVFKNKSDELLNGPLQFLHNKNGIIELIHDSFCQILIEQKSKRIDRWRSIVEHFALMFICILLCYKQTIFHPFYISLEPNSTLQVIINTSISICEIFAIVFLFLTIGLIRKSIPKYVSWVATAILVLPIVADIYINNPSANLPFAHHIISIILAVLVISTEFIKYKNMQKDSMNNNSWIDLLEIHSLRVWCLIFLCFLMYYYIFQAPNGYYVGNKVFTYFLMIIPPLFYSVFYPKKVTATWVLMMILLLPLSIVLYQTSETKLFSLSDDNSSNIKNLMIWIFLACYLLWSITSVAVDKLFNKIIVFCLFIAFYLGLYVLLYKNKLVLLIVYGSIYFFVHYLLCKVENKHELILCIATFFFTIGLYLFSLGYNPLIKNVKIIEQKGEWHWNTVIAKSGDDYRVFDAITGQDRLGIGFDYQDNNNNLVKALGPDENHGYSIFNQLYEVSDSAFIFKCNPIFERYIGREAQKKNLSAIIMQHHRKCIFNDFIKPEYQCTRNQLDNEIDQLKSQEMNTLMKTINTDNDSIIKQKLSQQLCRTLNSSWLYHASDRLDTIGGNQYFSYICAFNYFIDSYFYELLHNQKNLDWDGTFERISLKYIKCLNYYIAPSRDKFLETIIPLLITKYNETNDYGLRTMLYGKIIRLQQLAILYGFVHEDWSHIELESPVGVDINEFYYEHLQQ